MLRVLPAVFGTAVLYFISALVGLSLSFANTNISPVWPPAGIALALLLMHGPKLWPGVAIGAFSANYFTGLPVTVSAAIATGNTLAALTGAFLIARAASGHREDSLRRVQDVVAFVALSLVSAIVSASIGTTAVWLSGYAGKASYLYLWTTWWWGGSAGDIVIAPLVLSWWNKQTMGAKRFAEASLLLALLCATGLLVFFDLFEIGLPFLYLTIPLIVLIAFRFTHRGAAVAIFVLSIIAVAGTIRGFGPFQRSDLNESLLFLQSFMAVVATTALIVATIVEERTRAETERNDLFAREQEERKKAEHGLKEKEVLLQEVHHRVKNNLQVISSLLAMQSRRISDPDALIAFQESKNRIRSMALIHEKLYGSVDMSKVQFRDYLQSLVSELFELYGVNRDTIQLRIEQDERLMLDLNHAVPLALIANELISNSIKYAFPGGQGGEIRVQLRRGADSKVVFSISDNGVGVQAGSPTGATLGTRLVQIFVNQLEGTLELDRSQNGTHYRILF